MTWLTNIIITGLIEYIVVVAGDIVEGTINVNYKVIMEVLVEVYFIIISKRNATFIKS